MFNTYSLVRVELCNTQPTKAHITLVASHDDTSTRYLAHAFRYLKKSYVLCRACCTASAKQHVTARHDERSKRDKSVTTSAKGAIRSFVCNVYKVMIAGIPFNKRIKFICGLK